MKKKKFNLSLILNKLNIIESIKLNFILTTRYLDFFFLNITILSRVIFPILIFIHEN